MLTGRLIWPTATLLVFCVTSCENREPFAPITARQTRDPSGAFAKPLNSSSVQVGWADSAPNEIGFRIERSPNGTGSWVLAGTTDRNVTAFSDGGRSSEQQVCYRVFAIFHNGLSNPANSNCTTPPAAPTALSAAVVDHQAIDLSWTDNSAAEQYYEIERATAAGGPFATVALVTANTTTYRQSGLTTNTTYLYRVRPNRDGGYGDYSNVASATPVLGPPKAPSGTSVTPCCSYMTITWADNATNEDGVRVERTLDAGSTWTNLRTLGQNATVTYDYGVGREQAACYRVFAFNAQGDSPPSGIDCTAIPQGPTDLHAAAVGAAIELGWTDNSGVEDGYEVQRYDGVTAFHAVAQLPANSTTYRDVDVTSDVTYRYEVHAKRDGGSSYSSNQVTAVVATVAPAAPGNVHPISWGSTAVGITWVDNSTNEAGFRVDRSTDGGANWVTVGTSWFAAYYPDQFVDVGRATEEQVCYRAIAYNVAGDSPPSETACTVPLAAPTNLTATGTPEGVLVTWSDNSAFEDGYYVVLITDCAEQPEWWESLPANSTSYLDTSTYWCFGPTLGYYVVATKEGGWSDFSNGVSASSAGASLAAPPQKSITRLLVKP